jgi:hypothetical protein
MDRLSTVEVDLLLNSLDQLLLTVPTIFANLATFMRSTVLSFPLQLMFSVLGNSVVNMT